MPPAEQRLRRDPLTAHLSGASHAPIEPGDNLRWDLVLLDRDGTLNVRRSGYVERADQLQLLPGAARAVARLTAAGIPLVIVTNQQGVGKGRMSMTDLVAVHRRLVEELAPGRISAFAVCPHLAGTCGCRKPADGLLRQILQRAPWADPRRCLMVGDSDTDLVPALALGMAAVKVGQGVRRFDEHFVSTLPGV